ncbi:MAG: hypothetical protein AMS17_17065 [Spirochaetes bacterium DG_61]|nr:MAG: hypothetical protein AMS17_17065 [Spirochaetes bacterium DG_61]
MRHFSATVVSATPDMLEGLWYSHILPQERCSSSCRKRAKERRITYIPEKREKCINKTKQTITALTSVIILCWVLTVIHPFYESMGNRKFPLSLGFGRLMVKIESYWGCIQLPLYLFGGRK